MTAPPARPAPVGDPARTGTARLPDGRLLGWAEWGPPDGRPVVLCPGAATSRWLGCGADVVDGLGVRLVSVDRPGLGASTPAPGRTLADFATDLRALCAARDLGRPAVVGNSQGAPFALACAAAGVAGSLALVSAADEVATADRLDPGVRDLVALTARDPAAAEEFFTGFTAAAMRELVLTGSPACDRAVYGSPAFAAAYRRALDEGFAQGASGYARDTVLAMSRWPLDLAALTLPCDIWYGTEDTTHSPDRGARLTTRIPGAHRHLVPDTGGALLWTHTEEILTTLLAPAARDD
ncbi:alpha/beta fold hydrolase [Streptomyces catenulae]|uniref:Alpha/beta hydrolase n=1 Tax=Streptomyces catenulae TaxID=66875 RepID=A0ABV2Z356_9ACTN|nr:alpha/beta hydrolase [Streptomyces catenulae]